MEKISRFISLSRQIVEEWKNLDYISKNPSDELAIFLMGNIQELNFKFINNDFSINEFEEFLIQKKYIEKDEQLIFKLKSNLEIINSIYKNHSSFIANFNFHEFNIQLIKLKNCYGLNWILNDIKYAMERLSEITDVEQKKTTFEYITKCEKRRLEYEKNWEIIRKETLWIEDKHLFINTITICKSIQKIISNYTSEQDVNQPFSVNPKFFDMEFTGLIYNILNERILYCENAIDFYKFLNEPFPNKIIILKNQLTRLYYAIYLLDKTLDLFENRKNDKDDWLIMILNNLNIKKETYKSKYTFIETQDASETDIDFRNDIRIHINGYLKKSKLSELPPLKIKIK